MSGSMSGEEPIGSTFFNMFLIGKQQLICITKGLRGTLSRPFYLIFTSYRRPLMIKIYKILN